jgi:hypothetical protein
MGTSPNGPFNTQNFISNDDEDDDDDEDEVEEDEDDDDDDDELELELFELVNFDLSMS